MRRSLRPALLLLVGALLLSTVPVAAPPTPSHAVSPLGVPAALPPSAPSPPTPWPTYSYNNERTGANLLDHDIGPGNVSELTERWSIPSNGSDFSAPIVVNGTVYYGSWNGYEYAVNATSGALEWQQFTGTTYCNGGGYSPQGISSTAAYFEGSLYLGGGNMTWYALNATTGAVEWTYLAGNATMNYYDWAGALVYGGAVYIGLSSCFDNPLVPSGLVEVNLSSHLETAVFNSTPPGQVGESIWTTPAVDARTNTIWLTTGNENPPAYPPYANAVVALNATTLAVIGSWQVPNLVGQDADFGSTPTLFNAADGVPMIVGSNKNGVAYALNRSNVSVNGSWGPVWSASTGGGYSGGAFDGTTLYLAGSGIYAFVPGNGSQLWQAPMDGGGSVTGSLAWANGLVYAGGGSVIEAIDAANGTVLWNATLPGGLSTVSEPVIAGDELFVASGDYGTSGALTAYGMPTSTPYPVVFGESGLPVGKSWTASVNGVTRTSVGASITFLEPNGTFPYLLRGPGGFQVRGTAPGGSVTVAGLGSVVDFIFAPGPTFGLTFSQSGLPRLGPWCIDLSGYAACSNHLAMHVRNLTAGLYGYVEPPIAGWSLTSHFRGAVVPNAGALNLSRATIYGMHFAVYTYPVVFQETGLAAGTGWVVKVTGTIGGHLRTLTHASRAAAITFALPNGTFQYTVKRVLHYGGNGSASLVVAAAPVTVNVTFVRLAVLFPYPSGGSLTPPAVMRSAAGE